MGSPTRIPIVTPLARGEAYAENVLEGKVTPAQAELRNLCETPAQSTFAETAITADMLWMHAQLAMAFYIGYQAGQEENTRRVRGIVGRVKADVRKPARRKR